jgi:hypothetical protein
MHRHILEWKEFQKRLMSLNGIDLERVSGTEVQRGPVESVGYDFENHLLIRFEWLARLTESRRDSWRVMDTEPDDLEMKILMIGLQIVEWDNGRISIDDPMNPLAPTYTFLARESQLKKVRAF